jgi:hypothetical protein
VIMQISVDQKKAEEFLHEMGNLLSLVLSRYERGVEIREEQSKRVLDTYHKFANHLRDRGA